MVQYRDLNAPPSRMLADVVADMRASERQSKTGDAGVKDLGETGDVLWETPSGPTSVRVESENMRQLGIDLGELNEVILPELADDLDAAKTDLQQKLDAANARIDDIIVDGGGAGNFTTYSINEPTGTGTGEGDQWFRVVNGEVLGQWRWDGAAWVPVTLTDAVIAGIDLSKLVSNGSLSEVVANKIWADLFTANKITAQEIESGSITSQHIASEGIIADVIQGGHFTGETFEGGTFIGGEIRTSDELPGQVSLRDDGYVDGDGFSRPGIRINPTSPYNPAYPPGIGSNANGLIVSGGSNASGDRAFVTAEPTLVGLRSRNPQTGRDSQIYADASQAVLYSQSGTGGLSRVHADNSKVEITSQGSTGPRARASVSQYWADLVVFNADGSTNAEVYAYTYKAGVNGTFGGVRRSIYIDADGVWATQGSDQVSLIPEVRPFQYSAQWNADQSPAPIMVQHLPGGKLCQAQIRIQNLTGSPLSLPNATWVTLNYNPIPSDLRGGYTDYIETTLPQSSARGRIEMNYSTGSIRIRNMSGTDIAWTNNNSIWFPMRWFSPN